MARKGGPALYELLSNPKAAPLAGGAARPLAPTAAFSGSQTQVIAWIAVGVVAVVIAYLVGVNRGERLGRAAYSEEREQERQLLNGGRPATAGSASRETASGDAVPSATGAGVERQGVERQGVERQGASENRAQVDGNGISRGQALEDGPLSPLQLGADPRQAGLNYFVIATVSPPSAIATAQFCRDKGLDAYVVPSNNVRFSEVIVLPGFPATDRSSTAVKGLEARIRKVGTLYKNAARGNPDFGDMYHKLYKP
jgi:hypothetical protein